MMNEIYYAQKTARNRMFRNTCFMLHRVRMFTASMLTIFIALNSLAQNPMQDSLLHQFDSYRQNALQEKVFLHTDKEFYLAGEICWFKIYNVDAAFHMPIDVSKVAYVEVIDKNNRPLLQAKISLKGGYGNGSLFLPVSVSSGKYKIRAYTNWMKNFGLDYFFEKPITIINSQKKYYEETAKQKEKTEIKFFPEGGNLVNGMQSKIAFQVVNQNGKGIPCEGVVIDDKADTVAKYATLKFGIGNFLFAPKTGQTYKAVTVLPDGEKIIRELPAAFNEGYIMHLSTSGNSQIKIRVQSSGINPAQQTIYLFVHTRGSVKSVLSSTIQNNTADFFVDKDKLGDGVSHFTVFNGEGQPVCERLYFKYPEQGLQIKMSVDAQEYDLRKKVTVDVTALNQDGKPMEANMSMAVYQVDSLQKTDEVNISNYLWLSADLAGTVESPSYYFSNQDAGTEEAMDNLMLTNGWRRFRWEDILQHKKPVLQFVPEYVGHLIKGKITKPGSQLPAEAIECFLSVPGKRTQFRNAISDENGLVTFDMKDFYNEGGIIVQTNNALNNIYNIEISNPFIEKYTNKPLPAFSFDHVNAEAMLNHHVSFQVEKQYNSNKSKQFILPAIDTSSFYYKPDLTYLLDNYTRFTTLEEVLREYVSRVNVRIRNGKFHLQMIDKLKDGFFESDPLVLLDGLPIFEIDKLMSYDPLKIRKLDVVSRKYYLGNLFFDGILNFTTYDGNLPGYELDPHAIIIDYDGLQLQREFYSPVYETQQQADSRLPDFRNVLYWSPEIKTNAKGRQDIIFYTSDLPGKYAVVLQGLTADGKAGSQVKFFEVKETERAK
jgi:hypothetical protein